MVWLTLGAITIQELRLTRPRDTCFTRVKGYSLQCWLKLLIVTEWAQCNTPYKISGAPFTPGTLQRAENQAQLARGCTRPATHCSMPVLAPRWWNRRLEFDKLVILLPAGVGLEYWTIFRTSRWSAVMNHWTVERRDIWSNDIARSILSIKNHTFGISVPPNHICEGDSHARRASCDICDAKSHDPIV